MQISNDQLIVIATTLCGSERAHARREALLPELSKHGLSVTYLPGRRPEPGQPMEEVMQQYLLRMFKTFERTNYEYALICDDDYFPHPDLLSELSATVDCLPGDWRSLHLCTGWMWGRKFRDVKTASDIGKLNPEGDIDDLSLDSSGRFFREANDPRWAQKKIWHGGPIAILLRRERLAEFIADYESTCVEQPLLANDVILTTIASADDYVCASPQLGYENEQGGSTFSHSSRRRWWLVPRRA